MDGLSHGLYIMKHCELTIIRLT